MPSRSVPLINGQYYHVFNRGVAKMRTFNNVFDFKRFVKTLLYYQLKSNKPKFSAFTPETLLLKTDEKLVRIVCYVLMPNHFHLLLKQESDGGISELLSKLQNSYTKYVNTKYGRVGPLFQGQFKAVLIDSDELLLHVTRYIHLNPVSSFLVDNLSSYHWSSYDEYVSGVKGICDHEEIAFVLSYFSNDHSYKQFVHDQEDYAKTLEASKHALIDSTDVQSKTTSEV